jgi:hypothetical protein
LDEGLDHVRWQTVAPVVRVNRDPLKVAGVLEDLVALRSEREADDLAVALGANQRFGWPSR